MEYIEQLIKKFEEAMPAGPPEYRQAWQEEIVKIRAEFTASARQFDIAPLLANIPVNELLASLSLSGPQWRPKEDNALELLSVVSGMKMSEEEIKSEEGPLRLPKFNLEIYKKPLKLNSEQSEEERKCLMELFKARRAIEKKKEEDRGEGPAKE
ncbi:unnamed protein product [Caenorhabditis sp. 36 PRJEB53466]|nr:unnamed protein product [Caenorhabditis sp. 36 PRJEB53466]